MSLRHPASSSTAQAVGRTEVAPRTLAELFDQRVRHRPDDLAYVFLRDDLSSVDEVTYAVLAAQVRTLATYLGTRAKPGDRVVLAYATGLDAVRAFWAVTLAGMVAVPAPSPDAVRLKNSLPRLRTLIADSRATLVLTTTPVLDAARELGIEAATDAVPWVATDAVLANVSATTDAGALRHVVSASDLAYLQYTSGSTSTPRGVMITHANVLANCAATSAAYRPDETSRALSWLPYFHDYGLVHGVIWPVYVGIPAYLMSSVTFLRRPLRWLDAISRFGITHTGAPNFAYAACAQAVAYAREHGPEWTADLRTLAVASCGAEPINPVTVQQFQSAFAEFGLAPTAFSPGYGLAEATLMATIKPYGAIPTLLTVRTDALEAGHAEVVGDEDGVHANGDGTPDVTVDTRALVGCGMPIDDTEIAIVDPVSGAPCADNRVGDVWLASPSVGTGYWENDEATQATFGYTLADASGHPAARRAGTWLRTGDLGFLRDGELFITGRRKDLLIIHGRNYYPQDLEWTAERAASGLRAGYGAAFSVESEAGEQLVIVQEVERRGQGGDLPAATRAIRRAIADEHELPVHAVVLIRSGSIPRTSSGKIRRQQARQEFLDGQLDILHLDLRPFVADDDVEAIPEPVLTRAMFDALRTPEERQAAVEQFVQASLARLTRTPARDLPMDASPIECGLDSLGTFRFLQRIEATFGIALPPSRVLGATSLQMVVEQILVSATGADDRAVDTHETVCPSDEVPFTQSVAPDGTLRVPASAPQDAVWFVEQLIGPSATYHLAEAVRLRGPLRSDTLDRSLHALVARHASLRTTFVEQDGAAMQVIAPTVAFEMVTADVPGDTSDARERAMQAHVQAAAREPFDLSRGPLFRVHLLRMSASEHVLVLVVHHLVADGWSMGILARELDALYRADADTRVLPPRAVAEYAEYAQWQHGRLHGAAMHEHLAFWRTRLAGLPSLQLPTDRARPARMSFRGDIERFDIPAELVAQLKSLARQEHATLFMVLLAAFQALLSRYTGQDDLAVGSPVANRVRADFDDVFGFFTNTLVMRTDLSGDPTFTELIRRVRETTLSAYAHQELPSDRLVAELGMRRDLSRNALYPVAFALQNMPDTTITLDGVRSEPIPLHMGTAKSDLWLSLTEEHGVLHGELEYSTDLFDAATMQRMTRHFRTLLAGVVADPASHLARLPLLDDAERHQVLVAWNETTVPYSLAEGVHELFAAQAARTPDAVAVELAGTRWTYREVTMRTNQLAHELREMGVQPGVLVGVCMERSLELVVGVLAVLTAGGAYLPLDPEYPADRLAFMVRDASARIVLTHRVTQDRLPLDRLTGSDGRAAAPRLMCIDAEWDRIAARPASPPPGTSSPEDVAYTIYTSGSTGTPKGVPIAHKSLTNHILWIADVLSLSATDRVLQKTSISFDASIWEFFTPLAVGGAVVLAEPGGHRDSTYLTRVVRDASISAMLMVPSALRAWLEEADVATCTTLRHVVCGGEALDRAVVRDCARLLPNVTVGNFYGPTEAADDATHYPVTAALPGVGTVPIGRPIANARVYVLDAVRQPVPIGVAGELYIGGIGLSAGYLNRPDLTAERFVPDPFLAGERLYRTGDIVRYLADGNLEYLGRVDHQVKIRGMRVELGEVEAAMAAVPAVLSSAALVREDTPGLPRLVGYVVGDGIQPDDVKRALKTMLPEHMVPAVIVVLETMPLLPNGKVHRAALAALATPDVHRAIVAPRTSAEQTIWTVWRDLLRVPELSVHDNFFDVGGHSLLATKMISRLRDLARTDIPVRTLFEAPTVAEFAARLHALGVSLEASSRVSDGTVEGVPHSGIRALPARDTYPLSAAQEGLWFVDQMRGSSAAYNIPSVIRLRGALDIAALERSLDTIVRRHAILRTSVVSRDGVPRQVVHETVTVTLPVIAVGDVMRHQEETPESALRRILHEGMQQPFDLAHAPLLRATLFRVSGTDHVLLLVVHHIVADGWSMQVLARELQTAYSAFRAGDAPELAPLPVQFADYATWESEQLRQPRLLAQVDYWRRQLDGVETVELPSDHPRSADTTMRGGVASLHLSDALIDSVRGLARREQTTPFTVYLAAFNLLLARLSGQDDITVGTPVAGRNQTVLEGMVGCFVNTLVLRTDMSGDVDFTTILGRVRRTTLDAYSNQDVPFDQLVAELRPVRHLQRHPFFDVLVNYTDGVRDDAFELPGVDAEVLEPSLDVAKFAMTLYIHAVERGAELRLAYQRDLFSPERMAAVLEQYAGLLEQVAAAPDRPARDYSLVTAAARKYLPNPAAPIDTPPQRSLVAQFLHWVRTAPDQVAVSTTEQAWRYADVGRHAAWLATTFRAHGVQRGDVVAIRGARGVEVVSAMLASMMHGAVFLTVDPQLPRERQLLMIRTAGVKVLCLAGTPTDDDEVFAAEADVLVVRATSAEAMSSMDDAASAALLRELESTTEMAAHEPAYIFFTSGSTGTPKAIVGSHRSLSHFIEWQRTTFAVNPNDRVAQLIGLSFDPLLRDVFLPLVSGATLCIPQERDLIAPPRWLARERVTVVHTTPTILQSWLSDERTPIELPSLRWLFVAGEPLTDVVVRRWRDRATTWAQLVNLYGPTETTLAKCFSPVGGELADGIQPVGTALPQTQALVVGTAGQFCGVGEAGEIVLRTPFRSLGYLNLPEENRLRFRKNPFRDDEHDLLYHTGDIGRYRPDGTLDILGRADDQVKIRGVRVEPAEVAATLARHRAVRSCAVVVHRGALGEPELVAYVVAIRGAHVDARQLRVYLSEKLAEAFLPGAYVFLDALPLLPNGKVDRNALPAPSHETDESHRVRPRGPVEHAVWDIWRDVLKRPWIGVHDNFFELGGHSLLATQVIARIRATMHVELPLRVLFESPTIAQLAQRVTAAAGQTPLAEPAIDILPRDHGTSAFPVSFSQRRMWFVQQFEPQGTAYNMPFTIRLRGPLNRRAFRAAIDTVIERHEAFRTTFAVANGEPVQVISPPAPAQIRDVDLRGMPDHDRVAAAMQLFRAEAMRPFDLDVGPLYRLIVAQLGDHDHAVLWLMHHAIGDQWSAGVVLRELSVAYRAFNRGEPLVLPPLRVQYADFAAWQRQYLGGDVLQGQLAYWRDKLNGVPTLTLPTDKPRPARQTFHGGRAMAEFSPATLAQIRRMSAAQGVTPFMTLLACFQLLLARYSGQDDIAVGTPIANRTRVVTEELVGTLVNTLVMRTQVSDESTFKELLARVRDTALEAYAHQDLPFERLVEELGGTRDTSHSPLVQVLFNVVNAPMDERHLDGLQLAPFPFDTGAAQFDLSLSVDTEISGRMALAYASDLFTADTAERLVGHYIRLVEQVVANPDKPLSSYVIIADAERQRIVHDWNPAPTPYPSTHRTDQLISAQAARTPDAVAVGMGGYTASYAELEQRANQLAHYLHRRGVRRGDLVGICLERSFESVVSLLAVMKSGAAYVPLDPAFPRERLATMARDANLSVALTHSELLAVVPELANIAICVDRVVHDVAEGPSTPFESSGTPDDLAYVLYTSGSTGQPKGVEIPHRALTNFLWAMRATPGCSASDTLLSVTTLSFDISGLEVYLPLVTGGRVELASRQEISDGRLLLERMAQCRPTIMQATPATWRMLVDAGWEGDAALRILCGGEALPRDLAEALVGRCAELWNMYGPTETTIWSTVERIMRDDDGHVGEISIGRPIANTDVYILDRAMQPVPVGVPGELFIGGHGVARAYRNRPELTAERFIHHPFSNALGKTLYRTGDLARWLPDGRIVHLGRLDFQVKIRGFRIELGEIETVLARHSAVAQVVVAAKSDRGGMQRLVAYVVPRDRDRDDASRLVPDLRAFMQASLPVYMVPAQFVFLDAFPLTANNKVDVRRLPEPTDERAVSGVTYTEPRGQLEIQLTALWRQALDNESIGVHDSFFDLGGHSLKAVQLLSDIKDVTGRQLPLATLFQAPTVAQMVQLLTQSGWEPSWRSLVAIQPRGTATPIFAVPGVGGNVLVFAKLAKLLGTDQPFYGLQAKGLDGTDTPFTTVAEAAHHHIAEIRSTWPRGPYVIIGTCTGGVFAYEIAQQLRAEGEDVALAVIESWHPSSYRRHKWPSGLRVLGPFGYLGAKLWSYAKTLARTSPRQWPAFFKNKVHAAGTVLDKGVKEALADSDFHVDQVVDATLQAVATYDVHRYPGRLLNVVASQRRVAPGVTDTRGVWDTLTDEPSFRSAIPAEDSGRMFVSPHVEVLADLLKDYIR